MGTNKIGNIKTFYQLLTERESIVIPKVQRDYVYGRNDKKVGDILDGILTSSLEAIRDDEHVILDFVYGGSYVRQDDDVAGMVPLDGQQRLTTLFLLHFFASLLGNENHEPIADQEVDVLKKFRYETRQSATEFCSNLVSKIRKKLIESQYDPKNRNLKGLIVDDALYLSTYDSDPTITSMLNVLGKIEEKCLEIGVIDLQPCLWESLKTRNNVQFYELTFEDFGLSDDLFIKMNARGKKLTSFEIFKADMLSAIKIVDEDLKDKFSKKIDTQWVDIAWDYTDKTINSHRTALDITNEADKKYSMLFTNIFWLEFYRRNLLELDKKEPTIELILDSRDNIQSVIDLFDTLYRIHKDYSFDTLWYQYLYADDDVTGKDDMVRFFGRQKRSVFEDALYKELTVPETVYLYSFYLLQKNGCNEDITKRCLRIIRNLMRANVRAVDARTNKLHGFLKEVKFIIDNSGIMVRYDKDNGLLIDGESHKLAFLQNAWEEEFVKQQHLSSIYQDLLRYENHEILQCSLSLFMDYCSNHREQDSTSLANSYDTTELLDMLGKFESLFGNDYTDHFYDIKTRFLDKDIEYMQHEPYMERNANDKRRYFITGTWNLSSFFIKNANRKNQEKILDILKDMSLPVDNDNTKDHYKQFGIKDWQYYLAKYPKESNREGTRYGIGVWDDPVNYPLDLVLLNSSQHSEGNIEWMMMTNLLWNVIGEHDVYTLDDHGCSPIIITYNASTIRFKEGKWHVETTKDLQNAVSQSQNQSQIVVSPTGTNKFEVDLANPHSTNLYDYIDLGKEIIQLVKDAPPIQVVNNPSTEIVSPMESDAGTNRLS